MSIFKCKICGGTLEFLEGSSVCECQYCGTKQTLPKNSSEHSNTLYERADHFRRSNDFDKAISIYEQILNDDNTDAEAYWSLVLCRYGVEYVEDPKSNQRIATVNRMQYTSVLADEDYKSAIKYADASQKEIYEAEAREIDNIQKGILAISQKEEPFDVFICYKETDNNGRRTPDSVLANELYHQLDNEGYKVFFSRITLEDKLGSAYEPYIFAALNSAKVMVVIGTKPDYFNAVWVRNEWSRFLALIKNGANKVLIPAYRDMDPYDLPEEFSHLQAQDMSKLGFMQDLIRGIEKLTNASKPKYVAEQTVQSGTNTAPLLRRVYLFLEDGDWDSADEYCEKVLDLDPECGEAYLGKLMVQLKVRRREKLSEQTEPFHTNSNYQKALRFGDAKLQTELENCIKKINDRKEYNHLLSIYKKGEALLNTAKSEEDYLNASKVFTSIIKFEDSYDKAKLCNEKANDIHFSGLYATAVALMKSAKTEEDFAKASKAFEDIKEYKDSEQLAKECADKATNINKNAIYSAAIALMNGNKARNYKKAIVEFEKIKGFKDADQKIEYCNKKIEQINEAIRTAGFEKQAKAQERAEVLRERADAFKEKLPLIKKISLIVVPVLVIAIVAVTVLPKIDWNQKPTEDLTDSSLIDSSEEIESTDTSEESSSSSDTSSAQSSSSSSNNGNSKPQSTQKPSIKNSKKGIMPNFVGLTLAEAHQMMDYGNAGEPFSFVFPDGGYSFWAGYNASVPKGVAYKQNIPAGTKLTPNADEFYSEKIDVWFSTGTADPAIFTCVLPISRTETVTNMDSSIQIDEYGICAGKEVLITSTTYRDNVKTIVHKYDYDSNGNKIKSVGFDSDSSGNDFFETYEYHSNGQRSKCRGFTRGSQSDGVWCVAYEFEYGENGEIINSTHYPISGVGADEFFK